MDKIALKKAIAGVLQKQLGSLHYRAFLFGSRASGTHEERSDIDIGIEADRPIPLDVLGEIREQLESMPLMQKIDIVDFNRVDPEFKRVALLSVELIDER